jgi:5-oxopent-3-ene-1,2,5-tricarboxylate decarboxylase/2-hydroxyhepta-2,4-diene-1,7-dioate isomerase
MEHVAGYTIVNEFSLPEDSYYRPAVKAKCRDGFCALGPELVPRDQIADPEQLKLKLFVNGELRQQNSTAHFVRSVAQLIAQISEFMTLHEGDVLITGTPEGRVDVLPGDKVEVEISGLGRLVNHIVAE